ncbi:MAG TPA: DUF4331 domain-containing protein [Bryobacteraceae bacterium]|nr:DUF4331 domain-containing protein [Bryobacteraceae bacterium]
MTRGKTVLSTILAALMAVPVVPAQAGHRDAPGVALDQKANVTDFFAFVSYDDPTKVTFIMNVDPFLEPGNGPNYFPFDDGIQYSIKIDNNNDAVEDIVFQFQFTTEIRTPASAFAFLGAGTGVNAPANSPAPVAPGTQIIPPAITALDGAGSQGLSLRQHYTVTMVKGGVTTQLMNQAGGSLFAVPSNIGPRTMPNYPALAAQGIYSLGNGIRVFAGTTDDPSFGDLGAFFDTLNARVGAGGGVLTAAADADDHTNTAPDMFSGYNVNTIAIEVPITLLTKTGTLQPATSTAATIGAWATTGRQRTLVRRAPLPSVASGTYSQIHRMGNPFVDELMIPTGSKDLWSMSEPKNDSQFASSYSDPQFARILNSIYGIGIPVPPRTDLSLLTTYTPPIAAPGTTAGPAADMLRLNTGIAPTPMPSRRRLGLLAGDSAGFPNGRRVSDDVSDVVMRTLDGIFAGPTFNFRLGDGVNTNDIPFQETFPYVAWAQSGRQRRHIDPGEAGCTQSAGAPCPVN